MPAYSYGPEEVAGSGLSILGILLDQPACSTHLLEPRIRAALAEWMVCRWRPSPAVPESRGSTAAGARCPRTCLGCHVHVGVADNFGSFNPAAASDVRAAKRVRSEPCEIAALCLGFSGGLSENSPRTLRQRQPNAYNSGQMPFLYVLDFFSS